MKRFSINIIIYIFSFALLLFLTLNKHSKRELFHYRSEIYSDKAGYYIYLPYLVNYNLDAKSLPKNIDKVIGGFKLDTVNNRLENKYTCGIAIMQLPFFVMANVIAPVFNQARTGFSEIYHYGIDISSIFYLLIGMILFSKILKKVFDIKELIGFGFSWILLLSTNLFWYGIDETGMSHVYSFFLFTLYTYLLINFFEDERRIIYLLIKMALIIGLIILVRPINILFLPIPLFLNIENIKDLKLRLVRLFSLRNTLVITIGSFLVFLPQLIYWKYTYGEYFHYSYGDENFDWFNPSLSVLLFSPGTGLFPFNPIYLLFCFVLLYMTLKKRNLYYGSVLLFLGLISYVFSCWWDPGYGCSFGSRVFTEYSFYLSIPLFVLMHEIVKKRKYFQFMSMSLLVIVSIYVNIKLNYSYDGCFYGQGIWDWEAYYKLLQ